MEAAAETALAPRRTSTGGASVGGKSTASARSATARKSSTSTRQARGAAAENDEEEEEDEEWEWSSDDSDAYDDDSDDSDWEEQPAKRRRRVGQAGRGSTRSRGSSSGQSTASSSSTKRARVPASGSDAGPGATSGVGVSVGAGAAPTPHAAAGATPAAAAAASEKTGNGGTTGCKPGDKSDAAFGGGCGCGGKCIRGCPCKKSGRGCSDACTCSKAKCTNHQHVHHDTAAAAGNKQQLKPQQGVGTKGAAGASPASPGPASGPTPAPPGPTVDGLPSESEIIMVLDDSPPPRQPTSKSSRAVSRHSKSKRRVEADVPSGLPSESEIIMVLDESPAPIQHSTTRKVGGEVKSTAKPRTEKVKAKKQARNPLGAVDGNATTSRSGTKSAATKARLRGGVQKKKKKILSKAGVHPRNFSAHKRERPTDSGKSSGRDAAKHGATASNQAGSGGVTDRPTKRMRKLMAPQRALLPMR